jgi:hypothetical protein
MYVVGKGETVPSYTMKGTKNVNVQIWRGAYGLILWYKDYYI